MPIKYEINQSHGESEYVLKSHVQGSIRMGRGWEWNAISHKNSDKGKLLYWSRMRCGEGTSKYNEKL